jgi:hypothetical protein
VWGVALRIVGLMVEVAVVVLALNELFHWF